MCFALTGETKHTRIVALEQPGDAFDLNIPDTDETAPDRKLKELLADKSFGSIEDDSSSTEDDTQS